MSYKILGKYLSDLNRDFIRYSESKLSQYDLTLNMWRCMMIIENNKSCNLRNIAKVLNVDSAIITRNIKKLEDLKYVIKLKSDNDNRTFDLCLTDKGLDIFKLLNQNNRSLYHPIHHLHLLFHLL